MTTWIRGNNNIIVTVSYGFDLDEIKVGLCKIYNIDFFSSQMHGVKEVETTMGL